MTAHRWVDYSFIALTIALSVYGQLVLKWRLDQLGPLPAGAFNAVKHLLAALLDPAIASCFVAAFAASLTSMAAMTRFDLSYAYPFTSLSFVAVLLLSGWWFHEPVTLNKLIGVALIVAGTAVASARVD